MNSKEVNLLGFSHGGIIARYMVQECLNNGIGPKPRNLVTAGTPHMGAEAADFCETVTSASLWNIFSFTHWLHVVGCTLFEWQIKFIIFLP